jgi:hypothetical protein
VKPHVGISPGTGGSPDMKTPGRRALAILGQGVGAFGGLQAHERITPANRGHIMVARMAAGIVISGTMHLGLV